MKIHPVEHSVAPNYPDKYAEETRRVLAATAPRRWIAAPLAAGLAATVAIGLSGCGERAVMGDMPMPTEVTIGDGIPYSTEYFAAIAVANVIPLFEFGEGTGVIGCEVVNAPVFFSEEEAFAILAVAFAEAGLELNTNAKLQKATLPVTHIYDGNDGRPKDSPKTTQGDLLPDGLVNGMAVEFVSMSDVEAWEYKDNESYSSVGGFSTIGAAKTLAENNPGLIVFYDPVNWVNYNDLPRLEMEEGEDYEAYGKRYEKDEAFHSRYEAAREKAYGEARVNSEQQLRQQVQAFLAWMNTEGTH